MGRMEETQGDVVAIFDTQSAGRRFGSVEGTVVVQQPCLELHEEAELEDPKSQGSQKRSRDSARLNVRMQMRQNG